MVNSTLCRLCSKVLQQPGDCEVLHVCPGAKFGELMRILFGEEPADELIASQALPGQPL